MALSFEQIEPQFHKWARFFVNKRFEYWELINAAWLDGGVRFLPKSKIKLASKRIKLDMIDYMRRTSMHRRRQVRLSKGKTFPFTNNFSDIWPPMEDSDPFETTLIAKNIDNVEQKDFIEFIMNTFFMTRTEKLIIKLYYVDGLTQREIGETIGLEESRISQMKTNLIERLKAVDYSKAI